MNAVTNPNQVVELPNLLALARAQNKLIDALYQYGTENQATYKAEDEVRRLLAVINLKALS